MQTSAKALLGRPASAALGLMLAAGSALGAAPSVAATPAWVATWQASPQPVWGPDFLFPTNVPAVLHDQTVRQIARVSVGGQRVRIVLSNTYGRQPLKVGKATIARPERDGSVMASSLRNLSFGGEDEASVLPGASVISDPIAMPVAALSQLAVSVYLPDATPSTTFHWDGRQTNWIASGNQANAIDLKPGEAAVQTTTARLLLTGIQVETDQPARTVVVIGDSITDGATASLDKNNRWPDFMAERLAPQGVAVVNAGISGARLLSDGMGVNALARLERDVFSQPGVCSLIVMLGINDISWPGTAFERQAARPTFEALKSGYRQLVEQAHARGIRVLGATLTPFEGALPGTPLSDYFDSDKEALRQQVNAWIRQGGVFDAVIDFDVALRDAAHPSRMAAPYDSGDHLHPGDEGNRKMADAVDVRAVVYDAGILREPQGASHASRGPSP